MEHPDLSLQLHQDNPCLDAKVALQVNMKQYKGMNPTYFVGIQSLFDSNPAASLEDHNKQFDGKLTACSSRAHM